MSTRTIPRPGFKPRAAAPDPPQPTEGSSEQPSPHVITPKALVPGSVTAKVLARVWRGGELTIVDSPPGAGKTEMVATVVAHLAVRSGLQVLVGTPTKAQAAALVHRLIEQVTPKLVHCAVQGMEGMTPASTDFGREPPVVVATLAKAKRLDTARFDLLVVDEAYQATNASFRSAAEGIPQVLLVGDPGQIGPVVTVDTSIWHGQKDAPHLRAPEVTSGYTDVARFALDTTWRLGPASAAAVAPIYDFPFHSGAQRNGDRLRLCVTTDGEIIPEIESIEVPHVEYADDLGALALVADRVFRLSGSTLVSEGVTGPATASDIAVICSRNSQVSILTGMLRQRGLVDVTVGTADRLQGGQWAIVVAIDPFVGASGDSEYNASVGRLCVMASRHTTHLSWVHDDSWVAMSRGNTSVARKNRAVRTSLTANPIQCHIEEEV